MSLWDQLGQTMINGLDKAIDKETRAPAPINDDRTYSTVPGGGSIPNGYTLPDFIQPKSMMMLGGGLIALLVLLKVTKVI